MKSLILFFISFTLGFTGSVVRTNSDCLKGLPAPFIFLKQYEVKSGNKNEFSYVFTNGTSYMLGLCTMGGNDGAAIKIYDSQRNLVATTEGKALRGCVYTCLSSGIYYMRFESSEPTCEAYLAFNRKK